MLPFFLGLAGLLSVAQAAHVAVSSGLPKNASSVVNGEFLSLGIEAWSFPSYTGLKGSPNTFSLNMIQSIVNRTGTVPIRVGGTSRDFATYDPDQQTAITYNPSPPVYLFDSSTLGAPFLDGFSMVPGATWTLQVSFATLNLSNSILYLKDCMRVLPAGSLEAIEIGNEPNSYIGEGARPANYTPTEYVAEWTQWADAIMGNLSLPKEPIFWALSLNTEAYYPWTTPNIFKNCGLAAQSDKIKAVSQHYYQANDSESLQGDLLNHSFTAQQVSTKFGPAITYLDGSNKIPFLLGEVGSVLTPYDPALEQVLGDAVWTVDFMLYSMTQGIQRVNMQQLANNVFRYGGFSSWIPVESPISGGGGSTAGPEVLASWYGNVLIADLIKETSGELQVAPLYVSPDNGELSSGSIVAYAAYDAQKLNKVILLDEQLSSSTSSSPRPTTSVTVSGLTGISSVQVQSLNGLAGDSMQNITWADQEWSYASNGLPVTAANHTRTVAVKDGSVTVVIEATSVLVLSMIDT